MSHRIWDFPGGIHPPQNKSQSNQAAIAKAPLPAELIIPLAQHIGAPSKPVVSVGERVLKGQVIAKAAGFVSVSQHAPTSGEVLAIEARPVQHPSKINSLCIIIKVDNKDEWVQESAQKRFDDYRSEDPQTLVQHIRQCGITGMGGAGFPTAVKLTTKPNKSIEHFIINAVECEPYITADDRLMQDCTQEVIAGIEIFDHILKPKNILVGIEDNKPEAIKSMQQAAAASSSAIDIVVVPTKYPSGGEKQIIQVLTGKEVPSGGLPSDIGVVCQNTGTAYAVYKAVVHGEPLISRITTLTGEAVKNRGNFEVLIGTPVQHLLEMGQCDTEALHRLVMGGPMMGFTLHDTDIPVVKTTNCILAATAIELPDPSPEQPCIRCGTCAEACPASLLPQQLFWFAKAGEFEKAQQYNISDCIECGACAYVCPSNIPLVNYYRFAKGAIREQAIEVEKSDHARVRFEARQTRLEQEAAEKEAKRQARAKKAATAKKAKAEADAKQSLADPSAANKGQPNQTDSSDQQAQLKAGLAKAAKNWKDAEKALQAALSKGSIDADVQAKMAAKVERLKTKVDTAQAALEDAKASGAVSESTTTVNKSAAASTKASLQQADPLAELKQASQDTFQAYRDKKAELEANTDASKTAELESAVNELKAISDQTKAAMKHAREAEKEQKRALNQAKAGPKTAKQLKIDVAVASAKLKKAEKALAAADASDTSNLAALNSAVNLTRKDLATAQQELNAAQEVNETVSTTDNSSTNTSSVNQDSP